MPAFSNHPLWISEFLQVGRAGRFGTKGLAITFVASASDSDVLNQVGMSACHHYIVCTILCNLYR